MCRGDDDDGDEDDDSIIKMITSESVITSCLKVYCPWPGYLEGGKVDVI